MAAAARFFELSGHRELFPLYCIPVGHKCARCSFEGKTPSDILWHALTDHTGRCGRVFAVPGKRLKLLEAAHVTVSAHVDLEALGAAANKASPTTTVQQWKPSGRM